MPRVTISRQTFERMKAASPTAGILWESEGKVRFHKDGAVTLVIRDSTLTRLNEIAPNNPDLAIRTALDFFHARTPQ